MGRSRRNRNHGIADDVATGIHGLHRAADSLFWPLKPVDDVVHGVARGAFNWAVDKHPHEYYSSSDSDEEAPPPYKSKGSKGYYYPGSNFISGNENNAVGNAKSKGNMSDCGKINVNMPGSGRGAEDR